MDIDGDTYYLADVATGGALNTVDGDVSGAQQAIRAAISQVATQRGELGAFSVYTMGARSSRPLRNWVSYRPARRTVTGSRASRGW